MMMIVGNGGKVDGWGKGSDYGCSNHCNDNISQ